MIKQAAKRPSQRPLFLNLYVLAWNMGPTQLCQVVDQLGEGFEIVLPRTLLAMLPRE